SCSRAAKESRCCRSTAGTPTASPGAGARSAKPVSSLFSLSSDGPRESAEPRYSLAPMLAPRPPTDLARFAIAFDQRHRAPLHASIGAGARVEFVDWNREDLCMSFDDLERKVHEHRPRAVFLVHIGGHLAFDSDRIAELCRSEGIILIEDCAHAHGADWHGRR